MAQTISGHTKINPNEMKEKTESGIHKEKYQTLLESVNEGFCIIKVLFNKHDQPVDYRFLKINPAFEEQTGLADAEGKRIRELVPDHEKHWFDAYGKVALTGEPIHFERVAKALNRYYEVYAFPYGEPDERKVAVFFKDISRRKENEYSDAWLKAIINSSEDAIISKDLNGVITSWNSSAERLFGYTAEEAVGRNITLIIPKARLDEEDRILKRLKRGERINHFETVRERKDGSKLDISLTISPIQDSNGEIAGVSKIARNITKQKQVKKELRKMNETLEKRVEKRTEELQTYQLQLRSLASELGKAEEQERNRLATKLHSNLGQMLTVAKMQVDGINLSALPSSSANDIERLSALLDDTLSYTRKLMVELKPPPTFNKEEVREALEWVAKEMEKYDLNVVIEDDERPKPLTEERRTILYQCVRELLINIVKYAGVNKARLMLSRKGNYVRVAVEDEGVGFDMNTEKSIYIKEGQFGLFNIRERMDWMGGRFEIVSEPGGGTKAVLYAPAKEKGEGEMSGESIEEKSMSTDKNHSEADGGKKLKILIADDHQMVRNGFRQMIDKQDDLKVIAEAADGEETVRLARETTPDVILMDVNMPKMDGIEATKILSSDLMEICIIGLSLHDHEEVVENMRNAGASAYVSKDQAFETLCETIRKEAKMVKEK